MRVYAIMGLPEGMLASIAPPPILRGKGTSGEGELTMSRLEPIGIDAIALTDAVDLAALQRIQDTFSRAMGFAAVTVDRLGKPVTHNSGFQRVCQMIRSTERGLQRCIECDAEAGLTARARRGPHVYTCTGGLIDIAAPIIIQDEYLGCILCGQVIPAGSRKEFTEDIFRRNDRLCLPTTELAKAVQAIPSVPRARIDAAAEMLFQMANYIVEMGVANLTQAALLEEARRTAALQTALQEAQLRMLESQINPHFLFNALGLISYSAMQEKAPQTEEISYCLSDLLRYSLRSHDTPVTLGQELEAVQRYLAVQQMRFGARLNVNLEVNDSLRNRPIPVMLLQPLVENAVVHAFEPLARPVTVQVRATALSDGLQLDVSDDGAGMPADIIESIRQRKFNVRPGRNPVGLPNVIRRLELEFGPRASIQIVSQLGQGTQVTVCIPTM